MEFAYIPVHEYTVWYSKEQLPQNVQVSLQHYTEQLDLACVNCKSSSFKLLLNKNKNKMVYVGLRF